MQFRMQLSLCRLHHSLNVTCQVLAERFRLFATKMHVVPVPPFLKDTVLAVFHDLPLIANRDFGMSFDDFERPGSTITSPRDHLGLATG